MFTPLGRIAVLSLGAFVLGLLGFSEAAGEASPLLLTLGIILAVAALGNWLFTSRPRQNTL